MCSFLPDDNLGDNWWTTCGTPQSQDESVNLPEKVLREYLYAPSAALDLDCMIPRFSFSLLLTSQLDLSSCAIDCILMHNLSNWEARLDRFAHCSSTWLVVWCRNDPVRVLERNAS